MRTGLEVALEMYQAQRFSRRSDICTSVYFRKISLSEYTLGRSVFYGRTCVESVESTAYGKLSGKFNRRACNAAAAKVRVEREAHFSFIVSDVEQSETACEADVQVGNRQHY